MDNHEWFFFFSLKVRRPSIKAIDERLSLLFQVKFIVKFIVKVIVLLRLKIMLTLGSKATFPRCSTR